MKDDVCTEILWMSEEVEPFSDFFLSFGTGGELDGYAVIIVDFIGGIGNDDVGLYIA